MEHTTALDFWGLGPEQLEAWIEARGEPRYRARQLLEAAYKHGAESLAAVSTLPRRVRDAAGAELSLALPRARETSTDKGRAARKYLLELADGQCIEMVRIYAGYGDTLCLSTQVGCGLGCGFCATGLLGLRRNLSAGEIVAQVVLAARDEGLPDHLVFMGMGEPLQNYAATLAALRILTHPGALGMSPRRITLSTSGMVPEIHRLAREGMPLTLAISLGGASDELRSRLIPLGAVYRVSDVVGAARAYAASTGRRVSYEYLLLADTTDHRRDAERLAELLRGQLCHVNLLRYNPVSGLPFRASSPQREREFKARLEAAGIAATIRHSKGERIMAACGQLSRRRSPAPAAQPGA